MKLIESKAEYIPQESGIEGIYKIIEVAGRTAYNSQDKITPDSAKDFVDRMIKSKHGAALEAGTVYLFYSVSCYDREGQKLVSKYESNPYSKVIYVGVDDDESAEDGNYYNLIGNEACGNEQYVITTNYRTLIENNWLDDLQYICSPTEFHEKRYTMRFICDRGVSHELVRHRTFSFLQESTRYCNYSKDKFDNELTFIIPRTPSAVPGRYTHDEEVLSDNLNVPYCKGSAGWLFYKTLLQIEKTYQALTSAPPVGEIHPIFTPQQARQVLPNALKTELIMTGFSSDWRFLMDLRLFGKTGKVHPDMKDLMKKAQKAMQEAGIWEDIMSKPSKFE